MKTKLPQEPPKLEKLGKLDAIVLQTGKNDSDGNTWRPIVGEEKVPPKPLAQGLLSYLLGTWKAQ
jgi:hypothetical protein